MTTLNPKVGVLTPQPPTLFAHHNNRTLPLQIVISQPILTYFVYNYYQINRLLFVMPSYTEESLQRAIAAIQNGASQRDAVKQWGIPRSTLRGRLRGAPTKSDSQADRQKLSQVEEESLT